ncbi:MFS transporter [Nocardioides aromaticivorans]|uniref:MFS transporter n=1 Tax=Nocardioides aromaticivorans TaxID=200618 RepID=A0ABX7PJ77_9ACTN|nr:thiamine pyrophosphate-dependent enzyme [Nocardioides aromaticivorans]QSR25748.1 MFS transporter [Nocardioides aromaticivorans]
MEPVEEHFLDVVRRLPVPPEPSATSTPLDGDLLALFRAQATSRLLDLAARELQRAGAGYYTIGSAGHESNAALGMLSGPGDPALLHYRSGAFYAARALASGTVDPVRETLRGLTCSALDPASGGRHKVIGHPDLGIVPQTSTIASHLPRAVGLGFALGLAAASGRETGWAEDAVVVASFGDASLNHSTAAGALNAAAYLAHRHKDCPVLLVCEDNGLGISTPSPRGWVGAALQSVPGVPYFEVDGDAPIALLGVARHALAQVRETRRPAILHLHTVRFLGHAGSDVEIAYRSPRAIAADLERDPLLATARLLVERGVRTPSHLLDEYDALRADVASRTVEVRAEEPLRTRSQVIAPLALPERRPVVHRTAAAPGGVTLAQAINQTLAAELAADPGVLVLGEDVGAKGGVYGVTRGLAATFGAGRVFDTLLDEQTVLGTALGAALAGYTPVPEIQYLAYLHNAEDQLRGEAASLRFFSAGQHDNGMVVRIAGLAYQKGFGGHFHNDNSVAVLRDIPGLVLAVPSHPALAPALLRGCLELAREGRVVVFLEPIARYHTRDLVDGDEEWLAGFEPSGTVGLGDVAVHGSGTDLLLVTFGNGVHLGRTAALALEAEGIAATVLDLVWLAPLPVEALVDAARGARAVLVVDETRASGGVSEGVVTALVDAGVDVPLARVTSADSYVPLGPAAATVLLQVDEVVEAGRRLATSGSAQG